LDMLISVDIIDQFLCSICLDVFTDPVTIPCGHNFCKTCITEHWSVNVPCQCPLCKELHEKKPDLRVNTFISEMASQFRLSVQKGTSSSSEEQPTNTGEVLCDYCTETKQKALKSCLDCLVSYCETHLEPHQRIQALKRHKLYEHKSHQIVSHREEYEAKKVVLSETEAEVQKMIKERQVKIEDFKQSVKLNFIKELEEEISELTKRITEVEEHSRNKDHLQFLESFPLLNPAPPTKDWTKVRVYSSYEQVKKMCSDVELKEVQQFAVDVTLDPETAQRELILSDDGKQIRHASIKRIYSDSSKRFLSHFCVVGKQSFSSGRSYYEVQVGGKTDWLVGVARESINRKVPLTFSPQKGLWTVWLDEGKFKAYTDPPVRLCLNSKPQKVGVFVDYEEGLVSFYDVDAPALIYSFTGCNFTEKLFPIFNPKNNNGGRNSTPLIICPLFPSSVDKL
uniref:Uncharacterized protein n=1 Tax=Labrus bergylta TaxID=56723 RepID=A0A3Q3GA20_9LABR